MNPYSSHVVIERRNSFRRFLAVMAAGLAAGSVLWVGLLLVNDLVIAQDAPGAITSGPWTVAAVADADADNRTAQFRAEPGVSGHVFDALRVLEDGELLDLTFTRAGVPAEVGVVGDAEDAPLSVRIIPGANVTDSRVVTSGRASAGFNASPFGLTSSAIVTGLRRETGYGTLNGASCAGTMSTSAVAVSPVQVDYEPVIVSHVIWDNAAGTVAEEFKSDVSTSSSRSVESTWSMETSIGFSATVEVGVEAAGASAKASATVSESSTWGHGGSASKTVDVGSTSDIEGTVPPGQCQVAALTASRGTISADVTYHAVPNADATCHAFTPWHTYHVFHKHRTQVANDARDVLVSAGLPTAVVSTQHVAGDVFVDAVIAAYPLPGCDTSPDAIIGAINAGLERRGLP